MGSESLRSCVGRYSRSVFVGAKCRLLTPSTRPSQIHTTLCLPCGKLTPHWCCCPIMHESHCAHAALHGMSIMEPCSALPRHLNAPQDHLVKRNRSGRIKVFWLHSDISHFSLALDHTQQRSIAPILPTISDLSPFPRDDPRTRSR